MSGAGEKGACVFRPGDRIRCTQPKEDVVVVGGIYTVDYVTSSGEFVYIEECRGRSNGFFVSRFELVDRPTVAEPSLWRSGQLVVCVENVGDPGDACFLRTGAIYVVEKCECYNKDTTLVYIKDDPTPGGWHSSHFRPLWDVVL